MVTVTHFIPKGTEVFMEYALQDATVFVSLLVRRMQQFVRLFRQLERFELMLSLAHFPSCINRYNP